MQDKIVNIAHGGLPTHLGEKFTNKNSKERKQASKQANKKEKIKTERKKGRKEGRKKEKTLFTYCRGEIMRQRGLFL